MPCAFSPCPLEINNNGGLNSNSGLKREPLEYSSSATKNISPLPQCLKTLQDGDLPWGAPTHKITWPFNHGVLQNHVINYILYNSTTRVAMTTRLGMVAHHDGLLPIKSHDPLIMWSYDIMWQAKTSISPLTQCLRPRNWLGWWLILKSS